MPRFMSWTLQWQQETRLLRDILQPMEEASPEGRTGALNCTGSAALYTSSCAYADPKWWQEYRDILIADTFVDLTRLKLRAQQANPRACAPALAPAKRHSPSRTAAACARTFATHTPLFTRASGIDDAIAGRAVRNQRRGLEILARRIKGTCVKSVQCSSAPTRKSWLPCACAQAHYFVLLTITARLLCPLSSFSPCSPPAAGQVRGGLNHEKTL